jgi:hypothetical protein
MLSNKVGQRKNHSNNNHHNTILSRPSPAEVGFVPSPLYTTSTLQQARGRGGGGGGKTIPSASSLIPNPFQQLPWNVERETKRKARKLLLERSSLHRQLGIAEDATYEEIVAATDLLIARAEGDIKRKIQVEVAKDKILQIRLNERLAGLTSASTEAKAQSSYEYDG